MTPTVAAEMWTITSLSIDRTEYRFCDMMWALSGPIMSVPAVGQLFGMMAVLDSKKGTRFLFKQAGVLAERILRMVSLFRPDKASQIHSVEHLT